MPQTSNQRDFTPFCILGTRPVSPGRLAAVRAPQDPVQHRLEKSRVNRLEEKAVPIRRLPVLFTFVSGGDDNNRRARGEGAADVADGNVNIREDNIRLFALRNPCDLRHSGDSAWDMPEPGKNGAEACGAFFVGIDDQDPVGASLFSDKGEGEREPCPLAVRAVFGPDSSEVEFDDAAGDGETEAGAGFSPGWSGRELLKTVEEFLKVPLRKPRARVCDRPDNLIAGF